MRARLTYAWPGVTSPCTWSGFAFGAGGHAGVNSYIICLCRTGQSTNTRGARAWYDNLIFGNAAQAAQSDFKSKAYNLVNGSNTSEITTLPLEHTLHLRISKIANLMADPLVTVDLLSPQTGGGAKHVRILTQQPAHVHSSTHSLTRPSAAAFPDRSRRFPHAVSGPFCCLRSVQWFGT